MSQCEYCGSELPAGARFCGVCGRVQGRSQGASGYPAANRNNADETIGTGTSGSRKGSTRRPYQFTPLSSEPDANKQKPEPFILRPPQQPASHQAWPPVQPATPSLSARPDAVPASRPGRYNSGSPVARPASSGGPRRRKGCLIGCLSVVVLLVVVVGFAAVTLQRVLAFGSAISTQSPLSTQTGYMGGSDRVNLLVMGYGGSGHDGAYLTDSMVVMSLLPNNGHTTLISVPRDLWVQVPEGSANYGKINSVYEYASNNNANPVAGGNAAAQKMSLITGLDVKYWLTINFTGFKDFIDAIGGIDVYVPDSFNACYPRNDDASIDPGWIKVQFNKGWQHMDGARAIEYARAREPLEVCGKGTSENQAELTDFARSARQQIIIKAALSKVKSVSTWPSLYNALNVLSKAIYTNLSLADLGLFAQKMNLDSAHRVGLSNQNVLMDATSSDGQYILLPVNNNWQAIKDYVTKNLYN
ncbi:MAG TPA: LCP family protein [Ktedonobacteraceae bacterium]|jgi:LCP family protein required for cell wall assembly|nr:LCP family protein [Ktedonobacteraceae bacterium]